MRVLITGGAGFIGSHLADLLLSEGYEVRALDNLDPQVHGPGQIRPEYLNEEVELIIGDVRNSVQVEEALKGCDVLVHLAAAVGVGQSMYEIGRYTSVNDLGSAVVLEEAVKVRKRLSRVLVASSMSIYGEGLYKCPHCGIFAPRLRPSAQLMERKWEVFCPDCSSLAEPVPVPESKSLFPTSVYAVNKRTQEELFLAVGEAYSIPTTALRFFNVYGTRQSLSNPYTGVGAIFASRFLNNNPPVIFEDGGQSRDFIHVSDVARACFMAITNKSAGGMALNVGTGEPTTVLQIACAIAEELGKSTDDFIIRNEFRSGDIRHCFADVSLCRDVLGFSAAIGFQDGVSDLCSWVAGATASDLVDRATFELEERGLTL